MGTARFFGAVTAGCLFAAFGIGGPSVAQQSDVAPSGYQVGEGGQSAEAPAINSPKVGSVSAAEADNGPVRLVHVSYLKGDVSWRPDASVSWSAATLNLPMRQGAQVWASGHSRAEVQFDDGSDLRLGADAIVTLQTLYSDSQGEFTELRLMQGLASLSLPHGKSIFQVDTPTASVKAEGPVKLRVGVAQGTEVAVRDGKANIEDAQGKTFLEAGDYINITDPSAAFDIQDVPAPDGWDQFNDERDRVMAQASHDKNLSPQEGLVAGNLDDYGQWHHDPKYGEVWVPAEPTDWRPYHDGNWVWVDPFGWTWVGDEPWGWAPYHYGTWIDEPYGWGWCPGPRVQYWSPAVVDFVGCNGYIAWAPLAPFEVRYPAFLSVGFGGGDWSLFFSIGGCATYWAGDRYCFPHPWGNGYVNRFAFHGDYERFEPGRPFDAHSPVVRPGGFVPYNARLADGISRVQASIFGQTGRYEAVTRGVGAGLFAGGRPINATVAGRPLAGPAFARPDVAAYTPTHTFQTGLRAPQAALSRPVYRAAVAPSIARVGRHGGDFLAPSDRTASSVIRSESSRTFGNGLRTAFTPQAEAAARARQSLGISRQSAGGRYEGGFRAAQAGPRIRDFSRASIGGFVRSAGQGALSRQRPTSDGGRASTRSEGSRDAPRSDRIDGRGGQARGGFGGDNSRGNFGGGGFSGSFGGGFRGGRSR